MKRIEGNFFDSKSSLPYPATLVLDQNGIQIDSNSIHLASYNVAQAKSCPSPNANIFSIDFQDGKKFEAAQGSFDAEFSVLDLVPQRAWEKHWKLCTYSLIGFILVAFYSYLQLLPAMAKWITLRMPESIEQQIGRNLTGFIRLISINTQWKSDHKFNDAVYVVKGIFPELHVMFDICSALITITNAFAVPGGQVYVTEDLVTELTPDELIAVLLHEVGHVYYHHPMRIIIEQRFFSAAVMLVDDFGGPYGWGGTLLTLTHSREYEREADIFAGQALKKISRSPLLLSQALEHIEKLMQNQRIQFGWLSTHPITSERKKYLEAL